jgi:hypothetical protein
MRRAFRRERIFQETITQRRGYFSHLSPLNSNTAQNQDHFIQATYHGHTQQTPTFWDTALSQSEYNALNLDAGHSVAAGNPSVIDLINAKYDRIMSMHIVTFFL